MKQTKVNPPSIFIADDQQEFRHFVADTLSSEGYTITVFDPSTSPENLLRKNYDVAILDIRMPNRDGFEILKEIKDYSPDIQSIFITGYSDDDKLAKAVENGAFTFLTKPCSTGQLRDAVTGALRYNALHKGGNGHYGSTHLTKVGLVGNSTSMSKVREQIIKFAHIDVPVLITGESGTGKEIVANCIHKFSLRSKSPFIVVNCAALTPTLVESELFGHVKGAFTGAMQTKFGLFEAANNGTIFLDEIGELPLTLQAGLLRVLDSGEIRRVGEAETRKVNVRVISATNRDVEKSVRKGRFREDLYYRLHGLHITLSPLRERREDIPLLIDHFLSGTDCSITSSATELLKQNNWQGNVRELLMSISASKAFCKDTRITVETIKTVLNLNEEKEITGKEIQSYHEYKEQADRKYLQSLYTYTNGNISHASRISGIHRKNLREKLKLFGIFIGDIPFDHGIAFNGDHICGWFSD